MPNGAANEVLYSLCESLQPTSPAGVAVTFVFFITDCLFAIVMMVVWDQPWWLALAFFIFFGALDVLYLSATLNKVCLGIPLGLGKPESVRGLASEIQMRKTAGRWDVVPLAGGCGVGASSQSPF